MQNLAEFREVYLEELEEQLQAMEEEIMRLEKEGGSEAGVQRLFRTAHTLKGSSAAMGYERMKDLTHELEHLLDKARNQALEINDETADLFFRCLDVMKQLQTEIADQNKESFDTTPIIHELRRFAELSNSGKQEVVSDHSPLLSPETHAALLDSIGSGQRAAWVNLTIMPSCDMKAARFCLIDMQLRETELVFWSDPDFSSPALPEQLTTVRWLITTTKQLTELKQWAGSLTDVEEGTAVECDLSTLAVAALPEPMEPALSAQATAASGSERIKSPTIRVHVERLEHMMNLVGELVIDQTRMQLLDKELRNQLGASEAVESMSKLSDHLTRTISELQESMMKVRMLPIEQLFTRFPRMVRDISQTLGKEVELRIEGKETELDRTLIEDIGDPLIHLIRNALDHGIESPEQRREAGKPSRGVLRISASHEDNQVMIVVEDDGAGIHTDKVVKSAISKGVITEAEAQQLSNREALHLIFHPGFSTASQVSDISGRGVGMDIVRTQIERMNGLIEIETTKGKGTLFRIKLPLTLAIITGLLVEVSGQTFIIPMNNVAEIVRIVPEEIRKVRGIPVLTIRNEVIPIAWLHDCFGYERRAATSKPMPIVIIGRAEKRMALAVDELIGNQEIVIKSLGSFLGKVEGLSGATILGSGQVALILEIGGIVNMIGRHA
ncbi:chemotaxis protein CheA [Paenibacillaceae bacterium]|nr:chemotaxis protein CheA [Paenibacillaceae bacterium]